MCWQRWKIAFEGPQKNSHPFATTTLFFADPAGNNFAVYVPSNDGQSSAATDGRLTGVGYLELEAPKLDDSIKFYQAVLGFELLSRGQDAKSNRNQAAMRMASGQYLILTEVAIRPQGLSDEPQNPWARISASTSRRNSGAMRWPNSTGSAFPTATAGKRPKGATLAAPPALTWTILRVT